MWKSDADFLEHISDGFVVLDERWRFIHLNLRAERILGRRRKELLGRTVWEEYPDAVGTSWYRQCLRAARDRIQTTFEIDCPALELWAEARTYPRGNGLHVFVRDISERKRVQAALRREAEINASIAQLAGAILKFSSADKVSELVLSHAQKFTGSRYGFVGYIDPRTGFLVCPAFTGEMWPVSKIPGKETIFKEFRGLWGWVLNHKKPLLTNAPEKDPRFAGTPKGHLSIHRIISVPALVGDTLVGQVALINAGRDYTEADLEILTQMASLYAIAVQRRQQVEALQESEERYRTLVENIDLGITLVNSDYRVITANAAIGRMLERTAGRLIGELCYRCFAGRESPCAPCPGALAMKNGKPAVVVTQKRRSGEIRYVQIQAFPTFSPDGECSGFIEVAEDITDRKRAEFERGKLAALVEHSAEFIGLSNLRGELEYLNRAGRELVGLDPQEEITRYTIADFVPEEDRRRVRESFIPELPARQLVQGETRLRHFQTGQTIPLDRSSFLVKDPATGQPIALAVVGRDISERKEVERKIQRMAFYDPLTGLPNRRLFQERLEHALALAQREQHQVGVLYLDLDRFKEVNDSFGHSVGDQLLKAVAQRLVRCLRKTDTVARLGGDEFVAILENLNSRDAAEAAAQKILAELTCPYLLAERQIFSGCSIGIAFYPQDGKEVESLLSCADIAMYRAKEEGRQTYRFFSMSL